VVDSTPDIEMAEAVSDKPSYCEEVEYKEVDE
jgi:hypothetical protein